MIEAVVIASALLSVVGLVRWVQQEAKVDYARPSVRIDAEIYRRLERARKTLFRGSSDMRFTIFTPDPARLDVLRPIARLGYGRAPGNSQARFRKGEGAAGLIWGDTQTTLLVANLGPFKTDEEARSAQQKVLHLRPETSRLLSSDQLRAQNVIAARLECASLFRGVLCVDCVDPSLIPSTTDDQRLLWTEIVRLAGSIAPLLPTARVPRVEIRSLDTVQGAELKRVTFEAASV